MIKIRHHRPISRYFHATKFNPTKNSYLQWNGDGNGNIFTLFFLKFPSIFISLDGIDDYRKINNRAPEVCVCVCRTSDLLISTQTFNLAAC